MDHGKKIGYVQYIRKTLWYGEPPEQLGPTDWKNDAHDDLPEGKDPEKVNPFYPYQGGGEFGAKGDDKPAQGIWSMGDHPGLPSLKIKNGKEDPPESNVVKGTTDWAKAKAAIEKFWWGDTGTGFPAGTSWFEILFEFDVRVVQLTKPRKVLRQHLWFFSLKVDKEGNVRMEAQESN